MTAKNLFEAGFAGPIVTVNPHEQAIRANPQLPFCRGASPGAGPCGHCHAAANRSGDRRRPPAAGTRAVIVVTAGFGEGGSAEGAELRR